jgi:ribosomal protein S18 acetylase RimI-like enzyme
MNAGPQTGRTVLHWAVRREEDDAVIRAFLERDRDWAAYLLGDLDPPYRQHAHFYLAASDGVDGAVVLVYAPPEFTALVSMGEAEGAAAALAAIPELPARATLLIPTGHHEVFATHYRAETEWWMYRMALGPDDLRLPEQIDQAQRLTMADVGAIQRLLSARDYFAPFTPTMLEHGVYYGVWAEDRLVAVAGTHIVSEASRVAAIGNVYTAPEARRQGHALATTAAVARELFERGCLRTILNVNVENAAAVRVYERLGFTISSEFWESPDAVRRAPSA